MEGQWLINGRPARANSTATSGMIGITRCGARAGMSFWSIAKRQWRLNMPEETSEKPKNLASKLAAVMAEVDHVEKRGKNEIQHYSYVKAADVARAVRSGLASRGVAVASTILHRERYSLTFSDKFDPTKTRTMQAYDVVLSVRFTDSETGETETSEGIGSAFDAGDKAVYKAQTG